MAGDPQTLRKLYEVENEVAPDVPWYDDPIRRPFEEWVKSYEDNSVANLC